MRPEDEKSVRVLAAVVRKVVATLADDKSNHFLRE
jgi:hypothetical protein